MSQQLRISPPLLLGTGSVLDVSGDAMGYTRSIRGRGGYWLGDLSLTGPEKDLSRLFYESLGAHFEEKKNGVTTWEGMLYEMDLTYPTPRGRDGIVVTRRRSLDLLNNYMYGAYIQPNGVNKTLSVAKNDVSIARYGRKEEYLLLNGVKQAAAEARRNTYLAERAWPWARVVGVSATTGRKEATLDIALCGYIFTASWRYRTAGNGSDGNVSDFIKDLVTTDCATFLSNGRIETNTLQVTKGANNPVRTLDLLLGLADLGDTSGNPWWLQATNSRKIIYEAIPVTPFCYMHSGKYFQSAGGSTEIDPWTMKPGVIRDLTYPVASTELGNWLRDARDFYVSEVECGIGNGLVLKTDLFEDSEIMAAQAEYAAQMSGRGGDTSKNWWEVFSLAEGYSTKGRRMHEPGRVKWLSMSVEERQRWKKQYKQKKKNRG